MILRCCWRGLSPALLATPEGVNSSRSCSCQLSNSINKKVDGPHRGCTYGPNGLCRLSQGLSNYENNIHKQRGIVKQHKFRHFRKQKSDLQIASRCTSINRNVRKGRSPPWWPCALNNKLLSAVRPLRGSGYIARQPVRTCGTPVLLLQRSLATLKHQINDVRKSSPYGSLSLTLKVIYTTNTISIGITNRCSI